MGGSVLNKIDDNGVVFWFGGLEKGGGEMGRRKCGAHTIFFERKGKVFGIQ